jgi:hypothetical protein
MLDQEVYGFGTVDIFIPTYSTHEKYCTAYKHKLLDCVTGFCNLHHMLEGSEFTI